MTEPTTGEIRAGHEAAHDTMGVTWPTCTTCILLRRLAEAEADVKRLAAFREVVSEHVGYMRNALETTA